MILQAFVDDSYDADGVFVLAGHIASAESWAAFSAEWAEMLPHGTLKSGTDRFHFKMAEMASSPERMARVPGFYRLIEKHVLASISCKINIAELRRARARVFIPRAPVVWNEMENPYFVAFRCLMDSFHHKRQEFASLIPLNQKVDFYFDNQTEKCAIIAAWDSYVSGWPADLAPNFGATPRFEADDDFLPLQAADLWAWWVRKWYRDGTPEKIATGQFGDWSRHRKQHPKFGFEVTEDALVSTFSSQLAKANPGRQVFTITYTGWTPWPKPPATVPWQPESS